MKRLQDLGWNDTIGALAGTIAGAILAGVAAELAGIASEISRQRWIAVGVMAGGTLGLLLADVISRTGSDR